MTAPPAPVHQLRAAYLQNLHLFAQVQAGSDGAGYSLDARQAGADGLGPGGKPEVALSFQISLDGCEQKSHYADAAWGSTAPASADRTLIVS